MLRRTEGPMPVALSFAITLGVAPLLFVQVLFGHLLYSSSIVMAGWWFAIIPLLIVGYYAAYGVAFKFDGARRPVLAVVTIAVLLFVALMAWLLPKLWRAIRSVVARLAVLFGRAPPA